MLLPFLPGCSEQTGKINSLKEKVEALKESTSKSSLELLQLNQKLAGINRQISDQASKKIEFEEKSKKSGQTEKIVTKYREELEASLKKFKDDVADYRKQNLAP
ncbi:MAG: hypothetical protein JWL81_96 [Verrucomicrobiales bacterium]|nr:hypothetical protein [Verrucomicrobiales bacterium]